MVKGIPCELRAEKETNRPHDSPEHSERMKLVDSTLWFDSMKQRALLFTIQTNLQRFFIAVSFNFCFIQGNKGIQDNSMKEKTNCTLQGNSNGFGLYFFVHNSFSLVLGFQDHERLLRIRTLNCTYLKSRKSISWNLLIASH